VITVTQLANGQQLTVAQAAPATERTGHGRRGGLMALFIAFDLLHLNGDDCASARSAVIA
jgi:hypothetical protein